MPRAGARPRGRDTWEEVPSWGPLYAIVDLPHAGGLGPEVVAGGLAEAGVRLVQLRAKRASSAERAAHTRGLLPILHAHKAALIVNDDVEVALACGADGVHLGQEDLEVAGPARASYLRALRSRARAGFLVGLSTHSERQVSASVELDLDYIGFGPVFATGSKTNPDPVVGLEGLRRACEISSRPVVAIGGIGREEAPACIRAGAAAVAVIGALVATSAPALHERATDLLEVLRRALAARDRLLPG